MMHAHRRHRVSSPKKKNSKQTIDILPSQNSSHFLDRSDHGGGGGSAMTTTTTTAGDGIVPAGGGGGGGINASGASSTMGGGGGAGSGLGSIGHGHHHHRRNSNNRNNNNNNNNHHNNHKNSIGFIASIFSYVARTRRRWGKSHRENDTLLPTTYAASSAKGSALRQSSSSLLSTNHGSSTTSNHPVSKTCNSFLMGGHYYPGKDKKRRQMRRRTLWHRMFCSSPWRKVISFSIIIYIIFWHAIIPIFGWLLDVGRSLSAGSTGRYAKENWLLYDTSLLIPSVRVEKSQRNFLASERARIQYTSYRLGDSPRLNILENISPIWFHRNNPKRLQELQDEEDDANAKDINNNNKNDNNEVNNGTNQKKHSRSQRQYKNTIINDDKKSNISGDSSTQQQNDTKQQQQQLQLVEKEEDTSTTRKTTNDNEIDGDKKNKKLDDVVDSNRHNEKLKEDSAKQEHIQYTDTTKGSLTTKLKPTVVTGVGLPSRTLHTMDEPTSNAWSSSCPSSSSSPSATGLVDDDSDDWRTTLVMQTTLNRLWIINETCQRWKDPIIVVVFIPKNTAVTNDVKEESSSIPTLSISLPVSCSNHVQIIEYHGNEHESLIGYYPVNRLRNVGLQAVSTTHVIVTDIDFVPSQNLHSIIQRELQQRHRIMTGHNVDNVTKTVEQQTKMEEENRHAMIVPAFERVPPEPCQQQQEEEEENDQSEKTKKSNGQTSTSSTTTCDKYLQHDSSFLPKSFDQLYQCYKNDECIVFQSKVNWEGHSSTNSKAWLQRKWYDDNDEAMAKTTKNDKNNKDRRLRSVPCFHTARYEPYLVLRWCPSSSSSSAAAAAVTDLTNSTGMSSNSNTNDENDINNINIRSETRPVSPYYDERFYGYGKNKIQMISHLRKSGYIFDILPEGFIVHNPHPESKIKELWNHNDNGNGNEKNDDESENLHYHMDQLYSKYMKELKEKYISIQNKTIKECPRNSK